MKTPVIITAVLLLPAWAARAGRAAPATEISASELIENFSSMLESAPEPPSVTEAEVIELEEGDPKTYVFIRGAGAHPPKPLNFGGDGRLTLSRPDRGETAVARYRNRDGTYNQEEFGKLDRLMRCGLTGKDTRISLKLLEILDAVEDHFGKRGLTLLSGYRTPTFNKWVPGAARRSLHMLGWAADIRVPGSSPAEVGAYARKLRGGGVGSYPDAAFTHLDSGRPRNWIVRRAPDPPRAAPAAVPGTRAGAPRN